MKRILFVIAACVALAAATAQAARVDVVLTDVGTINVAASESPFVESEGATVYINAGGTTLRMSADAAINQFQLQEINGIELTNPVAVPSIAISDGAGNVVIAVTWTAKDDSIEPDPDDDTVPELLDVIRRRRKPIADTTVDAVKERVHAFVSKYTLIVGGKSSTACYQPCKPVHHVKHHHTGWHCTPKGCRIIRHH